MKSKKSKSVMWGRGVLAVLALFLSATLAMASSPKISKDLQGKNSADTVKVIVQFDRAPTAAYHQKVISRGGALKRELGRFRGASYTMPASALEDLASDPSVLYITPDRTLHGASSAWTLDYHNETINRDRASNGPGWHGHRHSRDRQRNRQRR